MDKENYTKTDSPSGINNIMAGVTATHNILYMTANSDAAQICQSYVPYWLYITAGVVDVVLLGLCAAYFIRRHQKMKAWKAVNQ